MATSITGGEKQNTPSSLNQARMDTKSPTLPNPALWGGPDHYALVGMTWKEFHKQVRAAHLDIPDTWSSSRRHRLETHTQQSAQPQQPTRSPFTFFFFFPKKTHTVGNIFFPAQTTHSRKKETSTGWNFMIMPTVRIVKPPPRAKVKFCCQKCNEV